MPDPKLPPCWNFCRCAGCGVYFLNPRAFDKHRIGPSTDRACMTTPQMRKAGLEQDRDYWRLPSKPFQPFPASRAPISRTISDIPDPDTPERKRA